MRFDGVGEAVFLANVQPEARTHRGTAEYVVEHDDGHPQMAAVFGYCSAYDAVAQVVVAFQGAVFRLVAVENLSLLADDMRWLAAKISHGQTLKFLETDVADGGQNHGVGAVVAGHEVENALLVESLYQILGSQNVAR